MLELFDSPVERVELDGAGSYAVVRRLTFGEITEAVATASARAKGDDMAMLVFLHYEITRRAVSEWGGPLFTLTKDVDGVGKTGAAIPCTVANVEKLPRHISDKLTPVAMRLNEGLSEEEGKA